MPNATVASKHTTQEERKAQSHEKIIEAAIKLIAKQGCRRTTMSEIGRKAGYAAGLISHKFGSKEGLLRAVLEHISESFFKRLRPPSGEESATEALKETVRFYLTEVSRSQSEIRALYVIIGESLVLPEIQDEVAEMSFRIRENLTKTIKRGIERKEFHRKTNPHDGAVLILGLLRGITSQALAEPNHFDTKKLIPIVQANMLKDLRHPS